MVHKLIRVDEKDRLTSEHFQLFRTSAAILDYILRHLNVAALYLTLSFKSFIYICIIPRSLTFSCTRLRSLSANSSSTF
ncbi:hypothetical protein C8Q75DRAFT_890822 [Abortiporus biennis]|nr:hypothetical protein C8Q75DRAFT_890822 [Abortiporus biennis]